jgi:hypothetical protein
MNALRVGSRHTCNLSHVISLQFQVGFGPGEIKSIESFQIVSIAEALENVPPELREKFMIYEFGLENSPYLVEARKAHPNCAMFPTELLDREAGVAYVDQMIYDLDPHISINDSIQTLDERARTAFSRIQQDLRLPPVISPDLNE